MRLKGCKALIYRASGNSMDEEAQASTTPFHTLDAFDGDLAQRMILALEDAEQGNTTTWQHFLEQEPELLHRLQEQGLEQPENYTSIAWDCATLLFTACVELTKDGRPLQIGERLNRERFGRFPNESGSAMLYFLEHIRPNRSVTENDGQVIYDALIDRLNQLTYCCTESHRGHTKFENGFGGMRIHGYLSASEVTELRKNIASRAWTASYEEPLDGGMADIAKHLSALLKAAERRRVGLALRTHR